jgi:hypothetical protein
MAQPLQQQTTLPCSHVLVTRPSHYFTPGRQYAVMTWNEGTPKVRNDLGSFTWLVDPRGWQAVPEPMTMRRSQELLHARYRADRARQETI